MSTLTETGILKLKKRSSKACWRHHFDSDFGYVLEVDLSYPDEIHDLHSDFPLAATKQKVDACLLGDYQEEILNYMQMNAPPSSKKLIQTLFPKKNYILHYQTLKLYVRLGLKVEKLHWSLAFNKPKWLAPYVNLNTQKRKQAKNKEASLEENFYKLMLNSAFGKTWGETQSHKSETGSKWRRNTEMDQRSTDEVVQNHWWELGNDELESDWNRVGQTNYRRCLHLRSFNEIHARLPLQYNEETLQL